jgi:hypothetical protein
LIDKLGPDASEEDNLNGSSILQDMLETKEFYGVICKRNIVVKIIEYAFANENNNSNSQNAALAVLN